MLNILFYFFIGLSFNKIVQSFLPLKQKKYYNILTFISMVIISTVIIFASDPVNISYYMIAFVAIMLIFYEGSYIEKISVVLILYPIIVSLNFMTNYTSFLFSHIIPVSNGYNYLVEIFTSLVSVVFWAVVYKVFSPVFISIRGLLNHKTWILIDIICLTPFIAIFSAIIFTPINKDYQIFLIAIACIVTNLGVISLISYFGKSLEVKAENQNLKLEASYYQEVLHNQQEIRKLKHDMNNHLSVILGMMSENNIEDARKYYEELSTSLHYVGKQFCSNSIINAVINSKYSIAIEHEIDCFFNIDIEGNLPINPLDLCSLFGNTLDNAIEACLKIQDTSNRKISLKARYESNYLSFHILNSHNGDMLYKSGIYSTTKKDTYLHGIGIKNIKHIVDKYEGVINIQHTDHEFEVLIAIKTS